MLTLDLIVFSAVMSEIEFFEDGIALRPIKIHVNEAWLELTLFVISRTLLLLRRNTSDSTLLIFCAITKDTFE